MSGVPLDTLYVKLGATVMTRKNRFGKLRFADSYLPYGLFVLISLALAGCSGPSPGAVVPAMEAPGPTLEDPPQSTVTILADSDTVEAGQLVSYTVNASPAPTADLTVHVAYRGVELAAEPPPATITIGAGEGAAMLTVQTAEGPGGTITASVIEGDGYTVGPAASALVTVTASPTDGGSTTGPDITGPVITEPVITEPVIIRPPPPANSVTINAVTPSVVEGNPVRFRVTATPAPAEDLTLSVSVTQTSPMRTTDTLPPVRIVAPAGSVVLTLTTTDDSVIQPAGTVTATLTGVTSGPSTYSIGPPASATVTVTDNDQDEDEAPRAAPSVLRSLQVIYGGFGYLNQEVTLSWQDPLHWRTARGTRGYQYRTVVVGTMSEWRSVTSSGGGPQSASIPVSVRGWVEYEMRAIQGGVVGPEASAGIVFIEAAPGSDTVTVSLLRVRRASSQLVANKPYTYDVEFYLDKADLPLREGVVREAVYYLYNDRGCTQFNTSSTTTLTETPSPTGRNQVLIFFNGPDLGEVGVRVAFLLGFTGNNHRANPAKFGECVGAGLTTW